MFRRVIYTLAVLGILCISYSRLIEPRWLSITKVTIESPKIKGRPIRLVHITDLHCDPTVRLEDQLPRAIARLEPDLIVFTGDAANSEEGVPVLKECLKRIAAIAPTCAVRGNFDTGLPGLFEGTGAVELGGNSISFEIDGTKVVVAGVNFGKDEGAFRLENELPPESYVICIHHLPDLFPGLAARGGADLCCAGHTHGGQVALPFYGALVTLSRFGKRYEYGLYRENGMHLFVSRGVGMEGGHAPRVRFCARPEVAIIEIVPAR